MDICDVAKVCHEANRALCESNGDASQKPWESADDWQRDSAIEGVVFRLENPDAPPSAQHDAWTASKLADGWKYGSVKDAGKKEHPCLVSFDNLPPEQQAKDRLFGAVVDALAPLVAEKSIL
jgi:hypothetical protein